MRPQAAALAGIAACGSSHSQAPDDGELQAQLGLPAGVPSDARAIAFCLDDQSPQMVPVPQGGFCNHLVATGGWPELLGSPRTELDLGRLSIRGASSAGTVLTILPAEHPAGTDALGRAQDRFYQAIDPGAPDYLEPDSSYTVAVDGAGTLPAASFPTGIFLPPAITVQTSRTTSAASICSA